MSSFSLGAKYQLLIAKQQAIATAIVAEIAYPDLVAKNVRDTNLLLTVSNVLGLVGPLPHNNMQMVE